VSVGLAVQVFHEGEEEGDEGDHGCDKEQLDEPLHVRVNVLFAEQRRLSVVLV